MEALLGEIWRRQCGLHDCARVRDSFSHESPSVWMRECCFPELWRCICELESGEVHLWCAFRWRDGTRGACLGSTHPTLKLASLFIYLCLNPMKEPNTVPLRTFLASTGEKKVACLFILVGVMNKIWISWGKKHLCSADWFARKFGSYNHIMYR